MSTRLPTSIWIPLSLTIAWAACSDPLDGSAAWNVGGTADAVVAADVRANPDGAPDGAPPPDDGSTAPVPDLPINCFGVGCPDGWNCNLTTLQCEAPCDAHSDCGAGLDCRPDRFCGCVAPEVECFGTCCNPEMEYLDSAGWGMVLDGTDTLHRFTVSEDGYYDYRWGPLGGDISSFDGQLDLPNPVHAEDLVAIGPQRMFATVKAGGDRTYLRRTDYDTFRVIPEAPFTYADVALHTDNQLRAAWPDGDVVMLSSEDNADWTMPTELPAAGGMALLSRPQGVALVTVADGQLVLHRWDDASGGYLEDGAVAVTGLLVEAIATSNGTPMAVMGKDELYIWRGGAWDRSQLVTGMQGLFDARFGDDGRGHVLILRYGSDPVYAWQDGPDTPWRFTDVAYHKWQWLGLRLEGAHPMLVGWHPDYDELVGISYVRQDR